MYISSGNEGEFINMKIPERSLRVVLRPFLSLRTAPRPTTPRASLLSMLDNTGDLETRWASWIFMQYMQSYDVCQKINSGESRLPFLKSVAASKGSWTTPPRHSWPAWSRISPTPIPASRPTPTPPADCTTMVVAMDNILNNDADVRTELESLINRLK